MNKKIATGIVFFLLSIVITYVVIQKVGVEEYKKFAIQDTTAINRIEIESKGKTLILEKQNSTWKSDKNVKISSDVVRYFLENLKRISFKTFVPKTERVKVNNLLDKQGSIVKIFERGSLKKSFIVGSPTADSSGTYMRFVDSNQAFIMHIVGYGGDLTDIFVNDVELWRDNLIFNYLPRDIASVEVQFLQKNENSFLLKTSPIQLFHSQQKIENINQEAVNQYLTYFMNLRYYGVDLTVKKDSLLKTNGIHKINVIDSKGKQTLIQTFPRLEKDKTLDMNTMYAILNNNSEVLILKYVSLDLITKKIAYFAKK